MIFAGMGIKSSGLTEKRNEFILYQEYKMQTSTMNLFKKLFMEGK
jgi:hypothetical protein